ncbi:S100 calcium binding protein W [Aulostomus maculatus]
MARLETAITTMVEVFLEYAGKEGKKRQLNKAELLKVLQEEIKSPELQGKISAADIDEAMTTIDKNQDGEIKFREFCRCVSILAKCYFQNKTGKGGRKGKGRDDDAEGDD